MRLPVTGAWYCDSTVSGDHAALIPWAHIDTSRGRVPLCPGGNVLYLRMAVWQGELLLAGQGHQDGFAWLWTGQTWVRLTTQTNGQKVVAFGPLGCYVATTPHLIEAFDLKTFEVKPVHIAPGSGGIQYVTPTGLVVLGDATYGVFHGLNEWTDLGDGIFIGQGNQGGGCRVWDGSALRELEPGNCRFIHASRIGGDVAVAFHSSTEAVFHWLTMAELRALPLVPTDDPHDDDEPDDEDEPTMPTIPNFLADIQPLWAIHGGPTDNHAVAFLRASVALLRKKDARIGLWRKGNEWGHDPDKLVFKLAEGGVWFVDIVANAGSASARPSWQDGTNHYYPDDDQTNWYAPEDSGGGGGGSDDPVPNDVQKQLDALAARIVALERKPAPGIHGKRIALKSDHGRYGSVQPDGSITFDREQALGWETLTVEEK